MKYKYLRAFLSLLGDIVLIQLVVCTAESPDLLTLHRGSIGTDDAIRAVRNMVTEQHLSMMVIEGTARTIAAAPDKSWNTIETPVIVQTQASNGLVEWTLDQNGQITRRDVTDRIPEPAPVIPDFQYLFPNPAITVTDIGTKEIDGTLFRLLQVDAPGYKKPAVKTIDPETGRCVREDLEQDGIPMTMTYSDFMTVDGITLPGKTVQEVSIPGLPPTTLTVTSIKINDTVDPALFDPPDDGDSDSVFPESGQVTVPLAIQGEHLVLEVGINGRAPVRFLLDSGAASTIIDCAYADELGLERVGGMHALGVGGAESVDKIEIDRLTIGEFEIDQLHLFCMDLQPIAGMLGMKDSLKGIIGYDLFARTVLKLDYAGKTMTLFDPAGFSYDGPGREVSGELSNNLLCVDGVIDGDIEGKLRIDTGAAGGVHLHAGHLRRHELMDRFEGGTPMEVHGAGGKMDVSQVKVASVALGEYVVQHPAATLNTGEGQTVLDTLDAVATVGNQVLSQFVVYFDFSKSRLILEPAGKRVPAAGDPLNLAGLLLSENDAGEIAATWIRENSPAAQAGLREGDRVVRFGKLRPGKGLTADTVNRMMYAAGRVTHRVDVIRDGETRTFRIKMM